VDAVVESDASPTTFVTVIASTAGRREENSGADAVAPARRGPLVVVGGPPGTGRTEVAVELALSLGRRARSLLVDADDVAPAVAQRLALPIEPNLRTAIEAVEHARADASASVVHEPVTTLAVLTGIPNAVGWQHVRPAEIVRVIEELGARAEVIVADGAGSLEDVGGTVRGRFATARALLTEADAVVAVCDASPVGVARLLAWVAEAAQLTGDAPIVALVNRAPSSRFRRGELFEELMSAAPFVDVVFAANDPRVVHAAWNGAVAQRGPFTRAIDALAVRVQAMLHDAGEGDAARVAS
jgi:hypothetical protein